ncbi:MAG: hypothetical protein UX11_C0019G0002 [Candidatus Collierbacteria bacterium GW2011_GWC2_45_40]|nr:MAG: hypothetical protein UX11_C0019G0002 [Candidatus Collierbacteria bacterium GW2011_GWC2_45_40]
MGSQCLDFDSVELGRLAGLWPDGQKTVFGRSGGAGGFDDQDLGREGGFAGKSGIGAGKEHGVN